MLKCLLLQRCILLFSKKSNQPNNPRKKKMGRETYCPVFLCDLVDRVLCEDEWRGAITVILGNCYPTIRVCVLPKASCTWPNRVHAACGAYVMTFPGPAVATYSLPFRCIWRGDCGWLCAGHSSVHNPVQLLMHLNGQLYTAAVDHGNVIMQALHVVRLCAWSLFCAAWLDWQIVWRKRWTGKCSHCGELLPDQSDRPISRSS